MIDFAINKPLSWNGKALAGHWLVTLKIDGVRAIWHDELGWQSRANKPLHNIPDWTGGPRDCELYVHSFVSISSTRGSNSARSSVPAPTMSSANYAMPEL